MAVILKTLKSNNNFQLKKQKISLMDKNKITSLNKIYNYEYFFCDTCLTRLTGKKFNASSKKLSSIKSDQKPDKNKKKCHICKDIFPTLINYLQFMLKKSSEYQFSTFLVGVILRPGTLDRDDFIRSKFKLRGTDSIKTDIFRFFFIFYFMNKFCKFFIFIIKKYAS